MRSNPWLRNSLILLLSLSAVGAGSQQRGGKAQPLPADMNATSSPLVMQDVEPFVLPGQENDTPLAIAARQARMVQEDRQKHLVADTAKLVELSTALQADVLRANGKNVLSLENVRRTEQIEKLAYKVRERMKS